SRALGGTRLARRRSHAQHTFTDGSGPGETRDVSNCGGHRLKLRSRRASFLLRSRHLSPRSAPLRLPYTHSCTITATLSSSCLTPPGGDRAPHANGPRRTARQSA